MSYSIISENPFRILGVYANSPRKDIVANKGRATAFLNVGRPVEYPLDLKSLLPSIERTLEMMNEAEAHLAIAKEQIKYAQFWFLKMTPIDDVAFNHLLAGDMQQAKEIWSKQESLSSLQNKLICYLIEAKPWLALKTAEKLYERFGESYISKVDANCTLQMSGTELLHQFIDSLGAEVGMQKLLGYELGAETKAYISSQTVGPLISRISSAVDRAKNVNRKDPKARIEAARKLVVDTKETFSLLKSILPATDSQYQMIADKLGLEILQCGIDYFNNADDDDKHQTAMKMQKYAQSIVVGTLAKQRCEENVRILQEIIEKLPPKEVKENHKAIMAFLAKFSLLPNSISYSVQLIKECAPHIVTIKEKLGNTHHYYLRISTTIVDNALGNIIAEVNNVQGKDFSSVKNVLVSAWRTQLYLDKFDLEPKYKEGRYKENRDTLYNIIDECKGFEDSGYSFMYEYGCGWCNNLDVSDVDLRTDEEFYLSCKSIPAFNEYLRRFPTGKYALNAKSEIESLTYKAAQTISKLKEFIRKYPQSRYVAQAKEKIIELTFKECKNISDFTAFIAQYPNSSFVPKAQETINNLKRLENALSSCQSVDEVIELYKKEQASLMLNKFSLKAFELAKKKDDYHKIVSTFGRYSTGGKQAQDKIDNEKDSPSVAPIITFAIIHILWGTIFFVLDENHNVDTFFIGMLVGLIGWIIYVNYLLLILLELFYKLISWIFRKAKRALGVLLFILLFLTVLATVLYNKSSENDNKYDGPSYYYSNPDIDDYAIDSPNVEVTDAYNYDSDNTIDIQSEETYTEAHYTTGARPYQSFYGKGTYDSNTDNSLTIKNGNGNDAVVFLETTSGKKVRHVYICAGQNYTMNNIPGGSYVVKIIQGNSWNDNKDNGPNAPTGGFMKNLSMSESGSNDILDFPRPSSGQYGSFEITLYKVQNGNMDTYPISSSEMFK